MTFDEERYAREVLEPARLADGRPPADLLLRYGLSAPLSAAQVAEILPAVLGCWRRARRELRYRRLVSRLEGDHARLASAFDRAKAGDLGPLRAAVDAAGSADQTGLRRLRTAIDDLAGPMGLITPQLVGELAADHGVPVDRLSPLLESAGVRVAAADPLPERPPVTGYPRYRQALRTLGCRHTADFVLEAAGGSGGAVTVWDTVTVAGTPQRVAASTVQAADRAWAARPHDGGRTLASTVLVALKTLVAERGAGGVAELVRYEVAEELRTRRRQGASATALVDYACEGLGLVAADARRMVFAVRAEPPAVAGSPPAPPAGPVSMAGPVSAEPAAPPAAPAAPPRSEVTGEQPTEPGPAPLAAYAPLPPPRGVTAERAGDEVVVRWEWPPELTEVRLRWQGRQTPVSRGAYRVQGGAWLPIAGHSKPLCIVLQPVGDRHGRQVTGPPLTVQVPGRIEAWYEVSRTGPPWRRELTVAVRSGRPARLRRLTVVLRPGTVMPLHAGDGKVLRQLDDVHLAPDRPLTLRLPVPREPYWLRCFAADDDVELRDPAVGQLRGRQT